MKGILLAGGHGSRLSPLTKTTSKQMLPIYDKPLIYYPLSTLMLANVREVLLISSPAHISQFETLLGSGSDFGIEISYAIQEQPSGIANALIVGEKFMRDSKVALILGDNIFHGSGLGRKLEQYTLVAGARIFGYRVANPSNYGVASLKSNGTVLELEEKPIKANSNIAIPGLYFLDESAPIRAQGIMPSARGELEIIDVLKSYLTEGELDLEMLPRGTAWFDSGTFNDLSDAGTYVRLMQERTGERVGDPREIALMRGWTS